MKITVDLIMHYTCDNWTRERVEEYFQGRESMSVEEFLAQDVCPQDLVYQASQWLPEPVKLDATTRIVTRAVTNHALHCGIPAVEQWAQHWLSGEDRSADAAAAARGAARRGAAYAAWDACRAAAGAAAEWQRILQDYRDAWRASHEAR